MFDGWQSNENKSTQIHFAENLLNAFYLLVRRTISTFKAFLRYSLLHEPTFSTFTNLSW